jgi:hypothetical protein
MTVVGQHRVLITQSARWHYRLRVRPGADDREAHALLRAWALVLGESIATTPHGYRVWPAPDGLQLVTWENDEVRWVCAVIRPGFDVWPDELGAIPDRRERQAALAARRAADQIEATRKIVEIHEQARQRAREARQRDHELHETRRRDATGHYLLLKDDPSGSPLEAILATLGPGPLRDAADHHFRNLCSVVRAFVRLGDARLDDQALVECAAFARQQLPARTFANLDNKGARKARRNGGARAAYGADRGDGQDREEVCDEQRARTEAALAEREACARVADLEGGIGGTSIRDAASQRVCQEPAAAIRARR